MNDVVTPLVSVVIPTYNYGRYLGRAVQSVLDQTYQNWEVIVIDNHSTDNTDEVMANFSDPRITYLKIHNNGIIAASRNAGIRVAKGEWVAFLDSDDWWHPDKIKECHECCGKDFDVFYHKLKVIRQNNAWRRRSICSWQVIPPVQIDLLMRGNALATSSVVVRRTILDRTSWFNESQSMVACEDYNLWLQIGAVTDRFYYCSKTLGYYMADGNGMSSKMDMSLPYKHAIEPFIHRLEASQKKYVEARVCYTKLRYAYLNKKYRFVVGSSIESIANGPLLMRFKSIIMAFVSALKSV